MSNAHQYLNPNGMSQPKAYSHVVVASGTRTVYISGQVSMDADENVVAVGDLKAQTEQVFHNLQTALAAVNASFEDVVKLNYYLLDMSQIQLVREVRMRYVNPERLPASTAVEVTRLAHPDFLIEIEAIAVLKD
jgi:enamine deaminase RidA (YjgF/YER057c/UK114 family)